MRMSADAYSSANSFVNAAKAVRIAPDVGNAASGSKAAQCLKYSTIAPPPARFDDGVTNRADANGVEEVDVHRRAPTSSLISRTFPLGRWPCC